MLQTNFQKDNTSTPLRPLSAEAGKTFCAKPTWESKTGTVKGITLNELLEQNGGFFDILKNRYRKRRAFYF